MDILAFSTAAERLDKRGWCQGTRHSTSGKSCLLGLFEEGTLIAFGGLLAEIKYPKEIELLSRVILEHPKFAKRLNHVDSYNGGRKPRLDDKTDIVAAFNNHPDTTCEDVHEVLSLAKSRCISPCPTTT